MKVFQFFFLILMKNDLHIYLNIDIDLKYVQLNFKRE